MLYNISMFKAGKVAIIGRPNVGKSTLLNALIKEKLSIISRKKETTRDNIQGIISGKDFQVVFIDTPGMHRPKNLLGKSMVRKASSTLQEADIILLLIDAYKGITPEDEQIFQKLPAEKTKLLIINKIDKIDKQRILPIIDKIKDFPFKEIIPVSAFKEDGTDIVLQEILKNLPEGFPFFPEGQLSDKNERFLVREIIREKILELTYQEIPHSIAVNIEEMEEKRDKSNNISYFIKALIYVEKKSQRGIVIGKSGDMLKKIGKLSRKEIEIRLNKHVRLDLWVKLHENWRQDPYKLKNLDY